ncbi:LPXTG cell wall anchor domain-containing protein [Jeotgalicoccus nanhaiensis]|uniref:LPXTG cell wall anchor domain-containing protein n=1 Tax=Jeotgalicoccus nanhaiensis TaxID=568603 RepID=A0ABR9XX01_9STAP|nr:N-acetylmuramoyl-L-alanine amidase [Jeotgalicoccus nanhaiensis]MBF0753524.1 LPXTG cell wall anchor domain-containing protein [Jeotgalicoccus nanhaiensis]TFU62679.1 LPXTG cell wall anchor domain-containing protein [Jeotgalicoccus nanhaiensis]
MKYKNRLIVPTLVSTSLLASTMVANAEEVDQDEQYQNSNTEEYAVSEEESERELDFIESEEESEDEESNENSEDKTSDEADEESSELEETAEAEEVAENELDESNIEEQATEEPAETPVEEPAEVNTVEEENAETAEEQVEEAAKPAVSEETVETTAAEEVVEEDTAVETEAEPDAEQEQEVEPEVSAETEAAVASEEAETEETAENIPTEPAEDQVQETQESEDVQSEETDATEEAEQLSEIEAEPATEEAAAEVDESEEAPTYKYNSDSLKEELENLSAEGQAAFLEENEDNIEADEQMLADLTESLALENEELNREEVYAAASTVSTMSLSDAITDINQYIADNNFDVAEIKYDYIPNLPKYAYHSDYGWEPENGEVGKPKGVVLHDVGNENSTIYGEIEYMSRNWENAFVHAFVDADNIIQVADTDYLAYGAGPVSNDMHMHVELMRYDNAHDFAKSINNYADYIANLLYKHKLPVVSAEETGEGTLYSHVAVSNHLGGTASPDPYEYFARFDYEYNDVINLIGQRYNDMYNKLTAPEISMPVEEGNTDLVAEVNPNNLGLYESVTDVRTKNADDLLGQQFRVVRTATYNYDDYYLLEDENGVSLGWMYAGDLTTSDYVPEAEEDENLEEEKPAETETPKEPAESEESISEEKEDTDNSTDNESNQNEEESNEFLEDEEANDIPDEDSDNESVSDDNETEEESASETPEASDDDTEGTDQPSRDHEESAELEVQEEREVLSSIEDGATGIRVVSESDELDGKSLAVTVLNPSNAINAAHDLYDIHVLDENGLLYNLQNPVTVYLPANGYVSNVYYLGDIGETLEAVNYRTEDGYAVFNVNSFSQYAVVYGNDNEDNTALPVLTGENDTGGEEGTADKANEHQTVYTEQDVDSAEETAPAASNDVSQDGSEEAEEAEEAEMLPDTGTPAQNTSIFAAILAALGLGFLVKRRKTTEK